MGEKGRGGHGGRERRIEVFVKIQKKSGGCQVCPGMGVEAGV